MDQASCKELRYKELITASDGRLVFTAPHAATPQRTKLRLQLQGAVHRTSKKFELTHLCHYYCCFCVCSSGSFSAPSSNKKSCTYDLDQSLPKYALNMGTAGSCLICIVSYAACR